MAQKKEEALATKKDLNETQQAMATLEGVDRGDTRGKENIDSDDVVLPFLAICQKTSPQLEPGEKFIEGLKFTDLFNSLTKDIVEQPVRFIPVILKKHAIEFNPFDQGGGIKDRDVPWDDERCEFNGDEKPTATRFYDWAVLLPDHGMELIVLSFKSTNISVAKQFQKLIQMRQGPAFAGVYTVKVVSTKNNYGAFGKLSVSPAGKPTQAEYDYADQVFESIKGKDIVVNHENDEPTEQRGDDNVPF